MSVLIAGSVALDRVKTPKDEHGDLLGGSASYAAIAASFFSPAALVAVVGKDFPEEHVELFKDQNVDLTGLEYTDGETFRWSGEYHEDMNSRDTLDVALNVLEAWEPKIPAELVASTKIAVLANAHPENQHAVIDQLGDNTKLTIADTMDLWITIARDRLDDLLKRIDLLVLNDGEAKQMMETTNLITAGHKLLEMGPRYVIIKKGEHGAMLFGKEKGEFFSTGAFPLHEVFDPTGAGDSFIGGFAGYLASLDRPGDYEFSDLTAAVVRGSIVAGYTCESFSTHKLQALTQEEFDARLAEFRGMTTFS
ncbi:PfkB family carbohydrate kinase [Verrucomicrobiales bacterium]|jgi:sugar/nucleoside kinase (ribokinase family)|nr:PfkB family carbohydrate kinase [Verrucomicrobiales bacterium]